MTIDTLIAIGIVLGAAFYLYRKFNKNSKNGDCACASGGGCCNGSQKHHHSSHSCTTKH